MPIAPGTKIGPYEILSPLGEGGMGAVWKAHDPTLQRTVAIKVLAKQDEDASARLLQEARAASALNHPHICTIHEVGEHEGQAFIVMEHVEGKALSQLIPSDGLAPESVIRYGTQIADALAHAHERGIVHRDLKSQNVVITPEGRAKVLDFGLAARMPSADAEAVTKTQEAIPHAGMLVGTLAYMAPEVLRGEVATARSDIWALGVLLYEMGRGQLPFGGDTVFDVTASIAKDTPEVLPRRLSPGLRGVIQRCLEKEPGQRYSSGAGVQGALEAAQSDFVHPFRIGIPASIIARPWRVVATLAVLAAAGLGYRWLPNAPDTPALLRPRNPIQLTSAIGVEKYVTWSPDEQRVAYESDQSGNWDIWVAQVGGQPPVNLTADHLGSDGAPAWSPDGTQIAFRSTRDGGGYYTMSALGGSAQRIFGTSISLGHPGWSPDGTELAGIIDNEDGTNAIEIVSLRGRESRRIGLPGPAYGYDLSWSPGGNYFAFVEAVSDDAPVSRLWTARTSDGELIPLTDGSAAVWSPTWSPDERSLYFVSNREGSMDLWRLPMAEDGTADGSPQAVTTGIGLWNATIGPSGSRLAYSQGGRVANVWRVPILPDREATWDDAEQITFDLAFIEFLDLSTNGEQLFVSSDRMGNQDLWELPAAGGAMRQLTEEPSADWGPRVSPDGSAVAFYSYRSGNRDVWIMPTEGGPMRRMTDDAAVDMLPAWSPDGGTLAFTSGRTGNLDIWMVAATGGEPRQLTTHPAPDVLPLWSPDGEWIGFTSFQTSSRGGAWRVRPEGGTPEPIHDDGSIFLDWSPDGQAIYVARATGFWEVAVDGGRERRVMNLAGKRGTSRTTGLPKAVSDGRYLYFTWREDQGNLWLVDLVAADGDD